MQDGLERLCDKGKMVSQMPGEQHLRDEWRERSLQTDWRELRNGRKVGVGRESIVGREKKSG